MAQDSALNPALPPRPVRVWDVPTRLFHWLAAALVLTSWFSIRRSWMDLHFASGYAMLALLLFRLAWGIAGSETARFVRFIASPLAALRHLRHLPRREADRQVGHNAAGGWMVLALLALLATQAGTGLFANDDLLTEGPFAALIGKSASDQASIIHIANFRLIVAAVALHVLAIASYAVFKRHNLIGPMLTGRKRLPADVVPPRMAPLWRAAVLAALAALAVASFAAGP